MEHANAHRSQQPFLIDGRRPILLLVDDSQDTLGYLQRGLRRGYDVRIAVDGQEAFSYARTNRPDIILSDVMMPRWDGNRLLHELRSDPDLKPIPMLFLTGKADEEARIEGLEGGIDDILIKPFSMRELETRLENLLRLFVLRRDDARLEASLNAEREAARLSNRLKDEFFRTLGHELRTPLMIIEGSAQILEKAPAGSAGFIRALETLRRGVSAEARIIDQIIDFSYLRSGLLELHQRAFDLKQIMPEIIIGQRAKARQKNVRIASEFLPGELPVMNDEARFKQVMNILVDNAIKFSPEGSLVVLRGMRDGSSCVIQVVDQGIGISPEVLPYVCDPFRQEDASLTRTHGGLGLGLAMAKEMMEKLGGELRVASAGTGRGTTVTLRLPSPP